MRQVLRSCGPLAALGLVLVAAPSPASACSCAPDTRPFLYLGAGNRIPAGAGLTWYGPHLSPLEEGRVTLETLDGEGRWIPAEFNVIEHGKSLVTIHPRTSWQFTRFRVSIRRFDKESLYTRPRGKPSPQPIQVVQEFTRADRSLDATEPLALRVDPPGIIKTTAPFSPPCSRKLRAAAVRIEATLPAALQPFRDYFLYETFVDGALWAPAAHNCDQFPAGRNRLWPKEPLGVDVVFAECMEDRAGTRYESAYPGGVPAGEHRVQVIVSDPEGRFRLASPSVPVTLRCDGGATTGDPTATDAAPPAGDDARPEVAASAAGDAEPPPHAQAASEANPPPHPPRVQGRCAVQERGSGWELLALVLVLVRRRPRAPRLARANHSS